MEDDEIIDKIEWLKERNKLEETANKVFNKFDKIRTKEREDLLKAQKKADINAKDNNRKYREDLKKTISEIDEVGKIKITKTDKDELFDFLMKPTIKSGNTYITPFREAMKMVYGDKKQLLALAKIVKAKFDITSIEASTTTKITQKIKKNLIKGTQDTGKKALWDFIGD